MAFHRFVFVGPNVCPSRRDLVSPGDLLKCAVQKGIDRIVITSPGGKGKLLALYIYLGTGADQTARMHFRSMMGQSFVLSASNIEPARFELARNGWCLVSNGPALRDFLSNAFELIANSDASVVKQEIWRDGTELRILLHISRLVT